jgi:hypothetical protein
MYNKVDGFPFTKSSRQALLPPSAYIGLFKKFSDWLIKLIGKCSTAFKIPALNGLLVFGKY